MNIDGIKFNSIIIFNIMYNFDVLMKKLFTFSIAASLVFLTIPSAFAASALPTVLCPSPIAVSQSGILRRDTNGEDTWDYNFSLDGWSGVISINSLLPTVLESKVKVYAQQMLKNIYTQRMPSQSLDWIGQPGHSAYFYVCTYPFKRSGWQQSDAITLDSPWYSLSGHIEVTNKKTKKLQQTLSRQIYVSRLIMQSLKSERYFTFISTFTPTTVNPGRRMYFCPPDSMINHDLHLNNVFHGGDWITALWSVYGNNITYDGLDFDTNLAEINDTDINTSQEAINRAATLKTVFDTSPQPVYFKSYLFNIGYLTCTYPQSAYHNDAISLSEMIDPIHPPIHPKPHIYFENALPHLYFVYLLPDGWSLQKLVHIGSQEMPEADVYERTPYTTWVLGWCHGNNCLQVYRHVHIDNTTSGVQSCSLLSKYGSVMVKNYTKIFINSIDPDTKTINISCSLW